MALRKKTSSIVLKMNLILFTVSILVLILSHCCSNSSSYPYKPQPYIIGGYNATDGLAPFQCSLKYLQSGKHFCGCVILSSKWIITSANCIRIFYPEDVQILVGTNDLKSGGTVYYIERWIIHDKFNEPPYSNDIVVIKVRGEIEFNEKVKSIEYSAEEVPAGAVAQLTGWGLTINENTSPMPNLLQAINLTVISHDECKSYYHSIDVSYLCTLNKAGEGICYGDYGGPLIYNNKLVGIVNFAVQCALGYPDGFAKVSYNYDWIKKNTEAQN